MLVLPPVRISVHALWLAADFTGAPSFAASLPHLPLHPPGASAGGASVQLLSGWGVTQRAHGGHALTGAGAGRIDAGARAHRLGDDFELVGAGLVVLLLVLDAAVVLQEELAGLLEHPAALTDGTAGRRARQLDLSFCCNNYTVIKELILLFFVCPVEEVGPLRTGLFAADPEHCRYPNDQSHQVLYQKQWEVRTVELCSLEHKTQVQTLIRPSWFKARV